MTGNTEKKAEKASASVSPTDGQQKNSPRRRRKNAEITLELESLLGQATDSVKAIDALKSHGDSKLAGLNAAVERVEKIASNAAASDKTLTALKKSIEDSTSVLTTDSIPAANEVVAEAKAFVASIQAQEKKVLQDVRDIEAQLEWLESTSATVQKHEATLKEFESEFAEITSKIEGLLPHATSIGLAAAFKKQKESFFWPKWVWAGIFIFCMLMLLLIGYFDAGKLLQTDEIPTWSDLLRFLIPRVPLIAPLVWLAIYCGRQHTLSQRLEEEYAYKEVLSSAFEGYKNQMEEVENVPDVPSPLLTLCNNALGSLAQRPGRIYEQKHEDITPLSSISQCADSLRALFADIQNAQRTGWLESLAKSVQAVAENLPEKRKTKQSTEDEE